MQKQSAIYKPSDKEILTNVLQSFEIENIYIPVTTAENIFKRVLDKLKKRSNNPLHK
jgi:hypothetical protein